MTTTVEAVYEYGVLRLMQPILLPEGTLVEVTVTTKQRSGATRTPAEILAGIADLAEASDDQEFTSRDHDTILYGEHGAR